MKNRHGFVSNSSSSSFVVRYRQTSWVGPEEDKQTYFLSKEQLKKLKKYGFEYNRANNPYCIYNNVEKSLKAFKRWDNVNLSYSVICNQDGVIYFLLKEKIPFVALCHYDQEIVTWDGKNENFYQTDNIIESVCKNHRKKDFDTGEDNQYYPVELCPHVKKYNVEEWLENEKRLVESLV